MSDIPLGPGWWQASDGKWYHPDLHPSARAARNAATIAAPAEDQTSFAAGSPAVASAPAEAPPANPAGAGSPPGTSAAAQSPPTAGPGHGSPLGAEPAAQPGPGSQQRPAGEPGPGGAEPSWPYRAEPSAVSEPRPSDYASQTSTGYDAQPSPSYGTDTTSTFAGRPASYAEARTGHTESPPTYTEPVPGYGQAGQHSQPAAGSRSSRGGVPEPFYPATTQASSHTAASAWWVKSALVAAFGLLLVGASWAISAVASFQTAPSEWYARLFAVAAAAGWILVAIAAALLARNGVAKSRVHDRR